MATVTRYVNTASTAGGDGTTNGTAGATRAYASQNEWESNEQTDLVTDGDVHVCRVNGSSADTTAVTIVGWTTGASNDITVIAHTDSDRADPSGYQTGIYRLQGGAAWSDLYNIDEDHVNLDGWQMQTTANNCDTINLNTLGTGADIEITCMWLQSTQGAGGNEIVTGGSGALACMLTNCVVYTSAASPTGSQNGIQIGFNSSSDWQLHNNTVYGCGTGIVNQCSNNAGGSVNRMRNNVCDQNGTDFASIDSDVNHANNVSSDATSPDGASWQNITVTWAGTGDFTFTDSETDLYDNGFDNSAIYTDSMGQPGATRPQGSAFDIGAFELSAAAPATRNRLLLTS